MKGLSHLVIGSICKTGLILLLNIKVVILLLAILVLKILRWKIMIFKTESCILKDLNVDLFGVHINKILRRNVQLANTNQDYQYSMAKRMRT